MWKIIQQSVLEENRSITVVVEDLVENASVISSDQSALFSVNPSAP